MSGRGLSAQQKRDEKRVTPICNRALIGYQIPIMETCRIMGVALSALRSGDDDATIAAKVSAYVATVGQRVD